MIPPGQTRDLRLEEHKYSCGRPRKKPKQETHTKNPRENPQKKLTQELPQTDSMRSIFKGRFERFITGRVTTLNSVAKLSNPARRPNNPNHPSNNSHERITDPILST